MTTLRTIALAAGTVLAFSAAASAADAVMPLPPAPVVVPPMASGFDWSGFYAGANVGGLNDIDDDNTHLTLGGQVGVNAVFDMFVIGAEVGLDAVLNNSPGADEFDDAFSYGDIIVRGGALISDPLLVYAAAGIGTDFDMPDAAGGVGDHFLLGGGLEFAVTNNVSVDGRYMYGFGMDAGDDDIHQFGLGVNFHF